MNAKSTKSKSEALKDETKVALKLQYKKLARKFIVHKHMEEFTYRKNNFW